MLSMKSIKNANELFKHHSSTDGYFNYSFDMMYTDGIESLVEKFECYWLLDVICSYQSGLKNHDFQVWTIEVSNDSSAVVICTDGNDNILRKQRIPFTDFKAETCTLWVEGNVILLPSEH